MVAYDIHLVGSIPLGNAAEVFETVAGKLGPRLLRIPDGETGARSHWLGWLVPTFSDNPAFEKTGGLSRPHATSDARPLHRLKGGIAREALRFPRLRIAEEAIASFRAFDRLKTSGTIPQRVRFQVCLANPLSVVARFVSEESQEQVLPAYEAALLGEVAKLALPFPTMRLPFNGISPRGSRLHWRSAGRRASARTATK